MTRVVVDVERVQDLIRAIETGDHTGLLKVETVDELVTISNTMNSNGTLHIIPADNSFLAVMQREPSVVLQAPRLSAGELSALEERCELSFHGGGPEQLTQTLGEGLWDDVRDKKRGLLGASAFVLTAVASLPLVEVGVAGDPPVQVLSSLSITLAGCVLAAFAIYSGLAQAGPLDEPTESRATGANYLGDRVFLGWVVVSIFSSSAAYLGYAIASALWSPFATIVHWLVVPSLMGVGVASICLPLRDVIPFLLGRQMDASAGRVTTRVLEDLRSGVHLVDGEQTSRD